MPIDTEQWRAQTGLFCASRVLLRPPRCKQPQPKVQADTLSLNMKFSLAVLLVTLRTGIFYASRALQLLCLIACHASRLLSSIVRLSCRRLRGVSVLLALCLVVVQMLLIMSGDVEENPGPPKIQTTSLGVSDLSCVLDELLDVSHNWFNLGLKLKLNPITLVCVRDQYPDPSTALREMLLLWLKKVDPPPTWEGLACALESRTVGEPRLAEQLRTKYCKTEGAAGGSVGQTVVATEEEQPSYPSKPIRRVCPAASKSYIPRPMTQKGGGLMRRKLSSTETHHSRHARVDPPPRRLPSTTSHIPQPIARKEVDPLDQQRKPLLIRRQRPAPHPPIYGPVPSFPAHTPVDQYASYLRSVYTSKKLPTYSKWPPSSSKKFINLAVVRKETVSKKEADEFTRATIHGTEIDNIYQRKEAVDFSRVGKLKDGSLAKLILVEGAPGIGKTTFAWEVCRKWASGEILQEYGLVVLLRLRDKRVCEVKTIFDLFHHPNPELSSAVGKEILYHEGESVLLLYEGYDELPRKLQEQQSVFLDVLHKNYLPRATILITSRPSATAYLRWEFQEQISQHIEILGFTKDDIISYVHDVIKDEQVCRDFHQYLKCYPYIRGMMYVPLNAVIVTEVYKSSQQSHEKFIPTTMTELYTAPTRSLLLRYLHSHSEYGQCKWNLKSFTDLPKELYEQFCNVTAVALKGMIEDTFVFNDLPHDFNTLDLMQSVPELYVEQGALVSYNFFHLTLQEYLAAVNISQQPVETQIEFLQASVPRPQRRRPLIHRAMSHSQPPHSQAPHHENPSYSQPPSTSSTPPLQCSKLNPHAKPFIPQHQFFAPGASPLLPTPTQNTFAPATLLHPPTVAPPTSGIPHPFLGTVSQPRALKRLKNAQQQLPQSHYVPPPQFVTADHPQQCNFLPHNQSLHPKQTHHEDLSLCSSHHQTFTSLSTPVHIPLEHQPHTQPSIPHQSHTSFTTALYPSTQYSYPRSTMTPPTPRMTQPFPQIMSTHAGDFTGDCTHYNTHPILPLGIVAPESSVLTRAGRLGVTHSSVTSDAGAIPIPSTTTIPQSGPLTLATQIKLADTKVLGMSFRLKNVLRFVAGLTKFRGIPFASLHPHILQKSLPHDGEYKTITLNSLHWLFETQCSDIYNEVVRPYNLLTKYNRFFNTILPFDYFVLGYAMAHITSHWEIKLNRNNIDDEEILILAAGVSFKRDNFTHSEENRTLQQLNVGYTSISDGGATALAEMLKENRTLQQLDVSENSIGDVGATALVEMLKKNSTLQQLNVSVNFIGSGGVTALAEMLKENRMLQQLNVSANFIGDVGATALAEMLKENRTLQQLNISANFVGDVGATALAGMLKENKTLRQLNVRGNHIGDGGATALAEMLKENRTLQLLDLYNNSIGDGGAIALVEMLKENRALQQLDVSYNSIDSRGATALAEMQALNKTVSISIESIV